MYIANACIDKCRLASTSVDKCKVRYQNRTRQKHLAHAGHVVVENLNTTRINEDRVFIDQSFNVSRYCGIYTSCPCQLI